MWLEITSGKNTPVLIYKSFEKCRSAKKREHFVQFCQENMKSLSCK